MLWVKVIKQIAEFGQPFSNSYYLDTTIPEPRQADALMEQITKYDMEFHVGQVYHIATCAIDVSQQTGQDSGGAMVWAPLGASLTGVRIASKPLPWRWGLLVSANFATGADVKHLYRFALDESEIVYNDVGGALWKPDRDLFDNLPYRMNAFYPLVVEYIRFGRGVSVDGAALVGIPALGISPTGLTVTNGLRKARARRIQVAAQNYEQMLGAAVATVNAWYQFRSYYDLALDDYYPQDIKTFAENVVSGILQTCQFYDALAEATIQSGDQLAQVLAIQNGPTWAQLSGESSSTEQKMDKAQETISKIQPFTGGDGDSYFHSADAFKMWQVIEYAPSMIAQYLFIDWSSTQCQGAVKADTFDDYTQGWPDLEFNAGTIPAPPIQKGRRIAPAPLIE